MMLRKIANMIFVLGLAPWFAAFLLGVMLFDAPGSESNPLARGLFYSILSYPLLTLVGFFASSGFRRMKDERHWRRYLAFLPLLSLVAAGAFFLAIERSCGGQFVCGP
jgi:hypothetical protein